MLRRTSFALLLSALLVLSVNAQDKADKPKTTHEDKLFGLTVKVEGFGNLNTPKPMKFVKAWVVEEGRNPAVQFGRQRETKSAEYAQTMGTAMLLMGMKETERKDAKLGSLKATLVTYGGTVLGKELASWVMMAEDKGDLWYLSTAFESADKDAATKLFNGMAKSFKNKAPKIDPKKPPAATLVISERFGFSIDTKGAVGIPEVFEDVEVFNMDIQQDEVQLGYLVVGWSGGLEPFSIDELLEIIGVAMESEGMVVNKAEKAKFCGKDAVRLEMTGEEEGETYQIMGYAMPAGSEMYTVLAAWHVDADEATQKRVKDALASVKLADAGKGAWWPKPEEE